MTITDKQVEVALTAAVKASNNGEFFVTGEDCMRAALEAAEAVRDAPADRAELVRHALKLMQKAQPWDGKTFDPELTHTLQLLAAAPSSAEQPASAEYVLRMLVAAGHVTQAKVDEARGIAAGLAPGAPEADERASSRELLRQAMAAMTKLRQGLESPDQNGGLYVFDAAAVRAFTDEQARLMYEERRLTDAPARDELDMFELYKSWPADVRAKLSCHDLRRMNLAARAQSSAAPSVAPVSAQAGEAVAWPGLSDLEYAIEQLRETGNYRDEEGEATDALDDLVKALKSGAAPPADARDGERVSIQLTGAEILQAARFVIPDWVMDGVSSRDMTDQLETLATIARDPPTAPAGLWIWLSEYPDEGAQRLEDEADRAMGGEA